MQHIRTLDTQLHNAPVWLTIGAYDGIHLGHQALIHELVSQAHKSHEQAVVVSLFPHPSLILGRNHAPFYLTSPDDRAELLEKLGVDVLYTYPFTKEVSNLRPQQFLQTLVERIAIRQLWVGDDFALGKDRQGSLEVLGELGKEFGYTLFIFKQVQVGDTIVSSSFIRERLMAGDLQTVKNMLGRNYSARGSLFSTTDKTTEPAHSFFFQTWDEQLLPPAGLYTCTLWLKGMEFECVADLISLVNRTNPLIEIKMLNFDCPFSSEPANLEFLQAISS